MKDTAYLASCTMQFAVAYMPLQCRVPLDVVEELGIWNE